MNREDIKEIQEKECTACSGSGCYCDGACGACNGTGNEYSRDDVDAFKDTYISELEHDLLEMSKAVKALSIENRKDSAYGEYQFCVSCGQHNGYDTKVNISDRHRENCQCEKAEQYIKDNT